MTVSLRPRQAQFVADCRSAMAEGHRRVIGYGPCAFGKTYCFSYIVEEAARRGKRVLILVHRQELLDQTCRALDEFAVHYGVIAAGRTPDAAAPVQVASVQSLVRRLAQWPEFHLIIVDEAHHCTVGGTWHRILSAYPNAFVLGVSASPMRHDGRPLGDVFEKLVIGPSVKELTESGLLSRAIIYAPAPGRGVDLSGVHIKMGDYDKTELNAVMSDKVIVGEAVAHYQRLAPGERAIAFCVSVAHAKQVAADFERGGVPSRSIDGTMERDERRALIRAFESGEIKVLTSCEIVSEGFDLPAVGAAILLRPTRSLAVAIQQVGRALRIFPGKDRALILDHANLTAMHGFPDDERDWSLVGKVKKKKKGDSGPPIRQCENCFCVMAAAKRTCPGCGTVFEVAGREVSQVDGELVEIDRAALARHKKMEQAMAKSFDQLVALGRARKYRYPHAWAKRIIALRTGKRRAA